MWWSVFERILCPPAGPLLLALAGLILWRYRIGTFAAIAGIGLAYAFSTPLVSTALVAPLERVQPLTKEDVPREGTVVMVVLSGGWIEHAPEYEDGTVNHWSFERAHYAARLHRQLDVPVLVSGGAGEAETVADLLETGFGVPVRWVDNQSRNTQENAFRSVALLEEVEPDAIILVTKALHFPRAVPAFARAGVDSVIPAPTGYFHRPAEDGGLDGWAVVPTPSAATRSYMALHEYVGRLWYWIRYR